MQANRNILSFTSSDTYFRPYKIVFQQFIADNLLGEFLVIDWGKLSKFCMAVWDYFVNTKDTQYFVSSLSLQILRMFRRYISSYEVKQKSCYTVYVDLTRIISCCFFSQKNECSKYFYGYILNTWISQLNTFIVILVKNTGYIQHLKWQHLLT